MYKTTTHPGLSLALYFWPNTIREARHRETLDKILALEELPAFEEVASLIQHIGEGRRDYGGNINTKRTLLEFEHLGHRLGFYIVPTVEFIDALVEDIGSLQFQGPIVEIAAGNGKLFYWLQKRGVGIVATDAYQFADHVEQLQDYRALERYNPELVIASWLDSWLIAKGIMNHPSVRLFIDIGQGPEGSPGGENSSYLYTENGYSPKYPFRVLEKSDKFALGFRDSFETDFEDRKLADKLIRRTHVYLLTKDQSP